MFPVIRLPDSALSYQQYKEIAVNLDNHGKISTSEPELPTTTLAGRSGCLRRPLNRVEFLITLRGTQSGLILRLFVCSI